MPPATRREIRLSGINGINSHTLAMEEVIGTFEQFKRKHIAQNRDIIKSNAMGQIKIRELETRIQDLEAERVGQNIDAVAMQAKLERYEYQMRCIEVGWKVMSQGLPDGFAFTSRGTTQQTVCNPDWRHLIPEHVHLTTTSNISLENSRLPIGVARKVARAPSPRLHSLPELSHSQESLHHSSRVGLGLEVDPRDFADDEHASGSRDATPRLSQHAMFGSDSPPRQLDELPNGESGIEEESSTEEEDDDSEYLGPPDTPAMFAHGPARIQRRISGRLRKHALGQPHRNLPESHPYQPKPLLWTSDPVHPNAVSNSMPEPPFDSISGSVPNQVVSMIDVDGAPSPIHSPGLDFGDSAWAPGDSADMNPPTPSDPLDQNPFDLRNQPTFDFPSDEEAPPRPKPAQRRSKLSETGPAAMARKRSVDHLSVPNSIDETEAALASAAENHTLEGGGGTGSDSEGVSGLSRISSFSSLRSGLSEFESDDEKEPRQEALSAASAVSAVPLTAVALADADRTRLPEKIEGLQIAEHTPRKGRERKTPLPDEDAVSQPASPAASVASTALAGRQSSADGDGRSRRVRQSVNYALPKLNTKMRKPDPEDMVPAQKDLVSSRMSTTGSEEGVPSPKHVASTGDLSEIRRKRLSGSSEKNADTTLDQGDEPTPLARKVVNLVEEAEDADSDEEKESRGSSPNEANEEKSDGAESNAFRDITEKLLSRPSAAGARPPLRRASKTIDVPPSATKAAAPPKPADSRSVTVAEQALKSAQRLIRPVLTTEERAKTFSGTSASRIGAVHAPSSVGRATAVNGPQRISLHAALTQSAAARKAPNEAAARAASSIMSTVQPSSAAGPGRVTAMQKKPVGATQPGSAAKAAVERRVM